MDGFGRTDGRTGSVANRRLQREEGKRKGEKVALYSAAAAAICQTLPLEDYLQGNPVAF